MYGNEHVKMSLTALIREEFRKLNPDDPKTILILEKAIMGISLTTDLLNIISEELLSLLERKGILCHGGCQGECKATTICEDPK